MKRTLISELSASIGQTVTVKGWVHALRDQKRMQFLIVRDHTGCVQTTVERSEHPSLAEAVSSLNRESAISLTGCVASNPQVKLGGIEIHATGIRIENQAVSPLPIDPFGASRPGLDLRLDWRHLDLRRPENVLMCRVQTTVEQAMREYWKSEGFVEIHTPKLMGTASESGAECFGLKYFGTTAYLAQSPQFYKQMAMAAGLDRIFEIAPVFRADPSFTPRHTTEFTSVDVEIAWTDSHEDIIAFEERWLRHVLDVAAREHGNEIAEHFGVELTVPTLPFPRIPLADAAERLAAEGYVPPSGKDGDLDPQGERLLGEHVRSEHNHAFVFVTDYPVSIRPFYHMRYEAEPGITRSFDLLWNGLEITTGAQREHRPDRLAAQAEEKGLSQESIRFYLDFFQYGCPPHGGFGLGLSRLMMILLGCSNLRETTFLPRTPNRLRP